MGVAHMDSALPAQAMLCLKRADTVYSARDEIYTAVGPALVDDCSGRIGELEEEPLFSNEFPQAVAELAEELDEDQVRVWGLFTLCRLVRLGERLAALPGCGSSGGFRTWAAPSMSSAAARPTSPAELLPSPAARTLRSLISTARWSLRS